jgi:hypothetical protein
MMSLIIKVLKAYLILVFKLELDDRGGQVMLLVKHESLGDNILFVGDNDSITYSFGQYEV